MSHTWLTPRQPCWTSHTPHRWALGCCGRSRQSGNWRVGPRSTPADISMHRGTSSWPSGMAVAANDVLLTARVRYCQAHQFQHLRHNKDALETLRLARDEVDRRVTPAVSAMLHGAEAASLAALGDGPSATRALGSATDEFDRINPDNEPDWMRFYDRGELLAQYGRVYRDLARKEGSDRYGEAATRTVTEAIDTLGSQNVRSSVLSGVSLCSSLFLADEPDEAVTVGARVIEQARQLSSPRILDRIHNLRRDLKRHERLSTVADFSRTVAAVGVGS